MVLLKGQQIPEAGVPQRDFEVINLVKSLQKNLSGDVKEYHDRAILSASCVPMGQSSHFDRLTLKDFMFSNKILAILLKSDLCEVT